MSFEVKQLRHFVAVVERGSITQAARSQHITQPALTRSIRNMEDRIGGPQLIRNSRSITPTEAGEVLYRYAQIISRQAEFALRDVSAMTRGDINVIVSNFPPGAVPADVTLKPLFKVGTEFVAGAAHPLAQREQVTTRFAWQ